MKPHFYCMAIFAMVLISCNSSSLEQPQEMQVADQTPESENNTAQFKKDENGQIPFADTVAVPSTPQNNVSTTRKNNPDWDKKIIKTATVQLELDDYNKFNTTVRNSVKQFGAYIAEEKQMESDYRIENSLSIKVPVAQFDALVNSFGGDGIKIMVKNISSQDITGEVVDTKSRMQAKLAVREKYLELLKQAKNMDEILRVQNEINEIQENIEAANGRIDYLQHASAYSTINLSYYQYINGSTANDEKPDFFTKLSRAFATGTSFIINLVLFMISIWPLILGGCIAWFYLKKFRVKKA